MITNVVTSVICFFFFVQSFRGFDDPLVEFETTFQEVVKRLRQKFRYLHFLLSDEQNNYSYLNNVQSLTNVTFNNWKFTTLTSTPSVHVIHVQPYSPMVEISLVEMELIGAGYCSEIFLWSEIKMLVLAVLEYRKICIEE